jgi:ABC-type antimicrobial peptide transport system permease subunit
MYRLRPGVDAGAALTTFAPIFSKYNPAYPYSYHFADESYAAKFSGELLIGRLAGIFAALAIFISCLGLFGLAAYVAQQRTKEIGIRKVLGASVTQVWLLLSGEFIVLVTLSCLIAAPVAFYFMHGWLQTYYYRITIGPWVFIASAAAAVGVTVLTIGLQTFSFSSAILSFLFSFNLAIFFLDPGFLFRGSGLDLCSKKKLPVV